MGYGGSSDVQTRERMIDQEAEVATGKRCIIRVEAR